MSKFQKKFSVKKFRNFWVGVIVRFTGIVIVVIKIDAQKLAQERIKVLF